MPEKSLPVSFLNTIACALYQTDISVTGANRGIGLGIAECCLVNGAERVYSIDIGETGDDFKVISERFPNKLFALKANVTQEETITAAVDQIVSEAGAIHGMVVNAGRTHHKAALDFTKDEFESLFTINLFGAFYSARAAARAFIKLGIKGSIVFTASMASYRPNKVLLSPTLYSFLLNLLTTTSESPPPPTAPPKPVSAT